MGCLFGVWEGGQNLAGSGENFKRTSVKVSSVAGF